MQDYPFSDPPPSRAADLPSTSTASPAPVSMMTKEGFSLRHREEVSEGEYREVTNLVARLNKWIEAAEHEEPMDEESLCTICYANEITVVFKPCEHTSCKSCISHQLMNTKECFFCKTPVESYSPIDKNPK